MTKRQKASQARAAQMQALYELSSDKDMSLNKKANFKTASVSLSQTMTPQQAIAAYKQTEREFLEKAPDPLLQERERQKVERLKAERKEQLKLDALVSGRSNYGTPVAARAAQMQAMYELNSEKDMSLNKKANFKKTGAVSLRPMTTQQAIAAMQKTEQEFVDKAPDPLLQEREREQVEREKVQRKAQLKREALVSGRSNYGTIPFGASYQNQPATVVTPDAKRSSSSFDSRPSPTTAIVQQNSTDSDIFDAMPVNRTALIRTTTSEDSEEKERLGLAVTALPLKTGRSTYGTPLSASLKSSSYQQHAAMTPSVQKYANSNIVSPGHQQYGGIPRNKTLDDDAENYRTDENNMLSIQRTGSGGLVMLGAATPDDKTRTNDGFPLEAQQRRQSRQNEAATPPSRLKLASQTPMRVLEAMKLRQQGYKASNGTLC
jgi:hypothetical protein